MPPGPRSAPACSDAFARSSCTGRCFGELSLAAAQVAGVSAGQYVRLFEWDYSKFAVRQRLPALVALIQGGVGKIEEEHRNLSMVFAEKNQAMQVRQTRVTHGGVVLALCVRFHTIRC